MLYLLYFGMPFLLSLLLSYKLCCEFQHVGLRLIPVYVGLLFVGAAVLYFTTDILSFIGVCGFEGVVLLAVGACVLLGSGAGRLLFERAK